MKKIKSLLLATSVIILGSVSPIQAFELESKSDPEPKRFLWEMVGSGRWQRTDGRSKAQMFLDSVWGEGRLEGSPFDDGGSFFSGSGSGDGKSMMSGGGGSVATLSTAVTHRAEENSKKTDFLAPLSTDFFRYNAPMPYGDDMIWFSFSPLAGTNPEAFLKVFGDLLERLKDEVRLGFVLRNLDQLTEETTQSFMNSFSDIVQRTISAQTEEEDVQRILSIEGEVPSRVITNIQSGPDKWQWLQYVDLSAATSSSPASGDRPALGRLLALPSMRHINLSHASLSSEELRSIIERCAEAQAEFSLDLSHTQLNDAVVEQIKKLLEETTYCRSLRLRNTGLNDEALEQIYDVFEEREMLDEPIPVDIDITANPLSEKMFNKWRQAMSESLFETVISTSLAGNYSDYKNDADVLKAFNEALNVEGPGVIIKGVRHISVRSLGELAQGMLRRPHLTELHFIDSPLPEAEDRLTPLMPVFTNGHITHLSFENVNFDLFDAECLYRALHTSATWADNFMSLNLSRNYLGSVIVPPLKPLLKKAKKLRRFNMAGNILGNGTSMLLINLANHKELEHLNLQANMITDKEMSKLWKWLGRGKLVGLKELDLAYNPANHEVFPQDIREGLAVRLDGLAMGEEMLNQWNTHTGGRINANTQSLTTLWQGMHAYVPLEYRGEVESAPTELWETSGQGTLMGGLKHVRLTGQPLLEGFQWKTHGEEVIASFKGAESLTVKGLSPELVPPLTRLLNTSPQLRSFSLKTGEGWQLEHVNGLLKAVPGGRLAHLKINTRPLPLTHAQAQQLLEEMAAKRELQTVGFKANGNITELLNILPLQGLGGLKRLTLSVPAKAEDVLQVIEGKELTKLVLDRINLREQLESLSKILPISIQHLALTRAELDEKDIQTLNTWLMRDMPHIENLSIAHNMNVEEFFPQLLSGLFAARSLYALDLSGVPVSSNLRSLVTTVIGQVPQLRILKIGGDSFQGATSQELQAAAGRGLEKTSNRAETSKKKLEEKVASLHRDLDYMCELTLTEKRRGWGFGMFAVRDFLGAAARDGQRDVCERLLAKGAKVDKATPLWVAAENGHLEVCELLLAKGATVDKARNDGTTPLYIAAELGHREVCELLLAKGAKVDQASSPLYIAAEKGHREVCELLLAKGAKVDQEAKNNGATPLWVAAEQGHRDVCELLLANGANPLKKTTYGKSPIDAAKTKEIKALLQSAADRQERK